MMIFWFEGKSQCLKIHEQLKDSELKILKKLQQEMYGAKEAGIFSLVFSHCKRFEWESKREANNNAIPSYPIKVKPAWIQTLLRKPQESCIILEWG